jgi:hypothetical protein
MDWEEEREYRRQERLGILCGTDKPTPEQETEAKKEADDAIVTLQLQDDDDE